MLHCVFLCNPVAGGARSRAGRARLAEHARRVLPEGQWRVTERAGHATELTAEAVRQGAARVVAVGGDGTVNEVARALIGSSAVLGIVPLGSGGGLARHLGLPLDPIAAFELARSETAAVRTIDAGVAGGRPFFNVMGLGLEADLSARFAASRERGLANYLRLGRQAYAQRRTERYEISADGRIHPAEAISLAVANSSQYGNGFQVAPDARVDDGLLNLVAIPDLGILRGMTLLTRMLRGAGGPWGRIVRISGKQFVISRASAGLIHVDGDAYPGGNTVMVEVLAGALRVVAPSAVNVVSSKDRRK